MDPLHWLYVRLDIPLSKVLRGRLVHNLVKMRQRTIYHLRYRVDIRLNLESSGHLAIYHRKCRVDFCLNPEFM